MNRERTRSDLVNEEWIMDKTKRRRQDRTKAVERGTNRHVVMFDLQMKFVVFPEFTILETVKKWIREEVHIQRETWEQSKKSVNVW